MATNGNITVKATEVVQLALGEEYAVDVQSKSLEVESAFLDLWSLAKEGYSITLGWDATRNQCTIRLAGITKGMSHNEGKLLYANGKTPQITLAAMWIKHFLVSQAKQWTGSSASKLDFS